MRYLSFGPAFVRGHFPSSSGVSLSTFIMLLLLLPLHAFAMQLTFTWDANTEPTLAGYKIYYGSASRDYTVSVDVGNYTTAALSGLDTGTVYYFAGTAYDIYGNESAFSPEAIYDPSQVDTDGDGLSDWDEVHVYGTDPTRADTDGDGLSDGDEVHVYGTDPTRADTDGDGFSDGVEVSQNSNPLDSRSIPTLSGVLLAVNAGGSSYVSTDGTSYQPDTQFTGGATYTTTAAIAGTADDSLYQSERYGNFSYDMPVTNGDYLVTLKFAEIYWSAVGQRIFDVEIEGQEVIHQLDLIAQVGPNVAYDVTIPISVTDGELTIRFHSVVNYAKVSAIKVEPSEEVFAVNVGGPQYIAANGTSYSADTFFTGGSTYTTTAPIAGTQDERLYQSERYGDFSYAIPLGNGDYVVTLKFAEIYWSDVGQRVFDVEIEGQVVISQLDLIAQVGPYMAYDVTVPVHVADGMLNIGFHSVIDYAKVSAIVIEAVGEP